MSDTKKQKSKFQVGNYILKSPEKYDRVVNGVVSDHGTQIGGIGEDAGTAAILAQYDRYGGLITTKSGEKVKTGSFWDFKKGEPRKKPVVMLEFRFENEVIEIEEGKPLPNIIRARKALAARRAKSVEADDADADTNEEDEVDSESADGSDEDTDEVDETNDSEGEEEGEGKLA